MTFNKLSSVPGKRAVTNPGLGGSIIAFLAAVGVFGSSMGWWALGEWTEMIAGLTAAVGTALAFFERLFTNEKITSLF